MSVTNQGTWLEKEIAVICADYYRRNLLKLDKVAPPVLRIGGRTIFQRNPFLDFIGAWTERAGRTICIEAKSTESPKLNLQADGGITEKQWESLLRWSVAGAAVGVLWGHRGEIRWCPLAAMEAQLRSGTKHLKWEHATVIPRGLGLVTWDFIKPLREYYPNPDRRR